MGERERKREPSRGQTSRSDKRGKHFCIDARATISNPPRENPDLAELTDSQNPTENPTENENKRKTSLLSRTLLNPPRAPPKTECLPVSERSEILGRHKTRLMYANRSQIKVARAFKQC